jgi:glutathione S-transferase
VSPGLDPTSPPPQVILYGRPGCHLCDEALAGLVALHQAGLRFELVEVDIESDERLHRELLELIPVIEVEGVRVSELLPDLDATRARLATVGA